MAREQGKHEEDSIAIGDACTHRRCGVWGRFVSQSLLPSLCCVACLVVVSTPVCIHNGAGQEIQWTQGIASTHAHPVMSRRECLRDPLSPPLWIAGQWVQGALDRGGDLGGVLGDCVGVCGCLRGLRWCVLWCVLWVVLGKPGVAGGWWLVAWMVWGACRWWSVGK